MKTLNRTFFFVLPVLAIGLIATACSPTDENAAPGSTGGAVTKPGPDAKNVKPNTTNKKETDAKTTTQQ